MYTETRNNFSIRSVILQFLFVALFVFILIWLFPMKSDMKKAIASIETTDNNGLSILYDRIFNENLYAMKEAAKDYFTLERLPQKVGDSTKITLKQMLDKKIILPFVDKNGKQCDLNASYVLVTKHDEEYVMKVNLKCGKEENYLIVNMGCYDYCSKTICEKKTTSTKKVVTTTKKKVTVKKYYCKYVNGKYYDNKGKVVSKTAYEKACVKKTEPKKYYCKIVNGKYYDNTGKIVSKETYIKACTKPEPVPMKYYCEIVNGKYYDKNGNVVTKEAFVESCMPGPVPTPHYCEIVNGKYYDATGKIVSKEAYELSCEEPEPEYQYLYEYKKVTEGTIKYSNWSEWTTKIIAPTSTLEVQTKEAKVKKLIGYNVTKQDDLSKPITEVKDAVVASKTVTSCAAYNVTSTITGYEKKYLGTFKYTTAPQETATYTYRKVGDYSWYCEGNCTAGTVMVYEKYQKIPVTSTSYSCAKTNTETSVYVAKQRVVTGYEKKQVKTPVYEYFTRIYYRSRTKTKTPGTTTLKWSTYNDTTLLNNGYHYTGNVKLEIIKK